MTMSNNVTHKVNQTVSTIVLGFCESCKTSFINLISITIFKIDKKIGYKMIPSVRNVPFSIRL